MTTSKKKSRKSRRRRLMRKVRIWACVILALLAAGLAGYLWLTGEPDGEDGNDAIESAIMQQYRKNSVVAAGAKNSAWIEDGRVTVIGSNESGQCNVQNWENIVAVALGDDHTVGLTADGALVFAGDNTWGQCSLDVGGAKVVSIAAQSYATYAVLEDGSVVMNGLGAANNADIEQERNVAVAAVSDSHLVLLKKDGTAVAYGSNEAGECSVEEWKNLIGVSCGYNATVALDSNGTVYITGDTAYGQKALDGTVKAENIAAGGNFCLIALKNGEVLGAGSNSRGQISVEAWKDVGAMACGYMHAIAAADDGTRIYSGSNNHGQQESGEVPASAGQPRGDELRG